MYLIICELLECSTTVLTKIRMAAKEDRPLLEDRPVLEDTTVLEDKVIKVTNENVSDWTQELSEIILVQRARVRRLSDKSPAGKNEKRKLESQESLLREAIIAYHSRVTQMRLTGDSGIREAQHKLESLRARLREAIIDQGTRVRKRKVKSEMKRLDALKADYKAATGSEWSEVREEGPILLTTNRVRGREIFPELRERVRELRRGNVIG